MSQPISRAKSAPPQRERCGALTMFQGAGGTGRAPVLINHIGQIPISKGATHASAHWALRLLFSCSLSPFRTASQQPAASRQKSRERAPAFPNRSLASPFPISHLNNPSTCSKDIEWDDDNRNPRSRVSAELALRRSPDISEEKRRRSLTHTHTHAVSREFRRGKTALRV